jgi:hypothetical protein
MTLGPGHVIDITYATFMQAESDSKLSRLFKLFGGDEQQRPAVTPSLEPQLNPASFSFGFQL